MMKRSEKYSRFIPWLPWILSFVALWAVWYFRYRHFMIWMEGFSFFSTSPDYTGIMMTSLKDVPMYIGAFLLQFFKYPVLGALIQAVMPLIPSACLMIVLGRLFEKPRNLYWMALLLLPVSVFLQLGDLNLSRSVSWALYALAVLLAVISVTVFVKPRLALPEFMNSSIMAFAVSLLAAGLSVYVLLDNRKLDRHHEEVAYLEYLGENRQWDEILKTVSRQDALKNEFCRKYVLLALSETGRLADYAFSYGLSGSSDFMFKNDFLFCKSYNVLFYKALGLANPAVYNAYQYSLQPASGVCFDSIRYLADLYLDMRDYPLAAKYLAVLEHSTCHRKWVEERLPRLEQIRGAEPLYAKQPMKVILESFMTDMASLVGRYPENRKYVDYLLCAQLSDKNAEAFLNTFSRLHDMHFSGGIPHIYQEALVLIASQNPDILKRFRIDEAVWARFEGFTEMMRQGRTAQAKKEYSDTYWAFVY